MAVIGLSIVLGGGGTTNPQTEMILEALIALAMVPLTALPTWQRGLGAVPTSVWLLSGLVLLIPVAQLVPLPPSVWHSLPGRGIEVQSLALIQADQNWMPLTMAPARTFASLLATICPVLVMIQVSRLPIKGRNWLCGTMVAGGIASVLLGVLQLSHTGAVEWSLYTEYHRGFLVGFQANKNAEADVLLITILAIGALVTARSGDGQPHAFTWAGFALCLLGLLVGLFMTGSRTGIALSLIPALILVVMLWPLLRRQKALFYGLGGITLLGLVGSVALLQLQSVQKVVARFALTNDARWDLWADTSFAIGKVWPYGSGVGTIVPMLEAAERLEVVDTTYPVRAHNDWLEWMLEAGIPGIVVLAVVLLLLGYLIIRAMMSVYRSDAGPARRAQILFALGVLVNEGLHAIVDYPMRSMSLAVLTAMAVAFLLEPAATQRNR